MPGALNKRGLTVGMLRHRVRIESLAQGLNEFREPTHTPVVEAASVAALVELDGGDEMPRSGGQQAKVVGTVTMRMRPGLAPKKRLVWLRAGGNLTLNITACPPHEGSANFVVCQVVAEA